MNKGRIKKMVTCVGISLCVSMSGLLTVGAVGNDTIAPTASAYPYGDTIAPAAPAYIHAYHDNGTLSLYWETSTDNVGVVGYEVILCSSTQHCTGRIKVTNNWYSCAAAMGPSYDIMVYALDAAGNRSAGKRAYLPASW